MDFTRFLTQVTPADPNGGVANAIHGLGMFGQLQRQDAQLKERANEFEREQQRAGVLDAWNRQKDVAGMLDKYNSLLAIDPDQAAGFETVLRSMGVQFHPAEQEHPAARDVVTPPGAPAPVQAAPPLAAGAGEERGETTQEPAAAERAEPEHGNIDLTDRPAVRNKDGSVSTVRSIGVNIDGKETLLPTVSDDGRIMSEKEAIDTFRRTGKHLGRFGTVAEANTAAKAIHDQQARDYADQLSPPPTTGGKPIPRLLSAFMSEQAKIKPEESAYPSLGEIAQSAENVRSIGGTPEEPNAPVDPNVGPPDEIAAALKRPMTAEEAAAVLTPQQIRDLMNASAKSGADLDPGIYQAPKGLRRLPDGTPIPDRDLDPGIVMRRRPGTLPDGTPIPEGNLDPGIAVDPRKTPGLYGNPVPAPHWVSGAELRQRAAAPQDPYTGAYGAEGAKGGTKPAAFSVAAHPVKAPATPEGQAAAVALQAQGIRPALPAFRASFNGIDLGTFDPEAARERLKRQAGETAGSYAAATTEKYRPLVEALIASGHSPAEIHEMMKTFVGPEVLHLIGADAAVRAAGKKGGGPPVSETLAEEKDGRASVREFTSSAENPGLQDDIKSVKYLPKLMESLQHPKNGMDASFVVREIMLALNKGAFSDKDAAAYMTDVSVWDKFKNLVSRQQYSSIDKDMLQAIAGAVQHKLELAEDNVGNAYNTLVESNQYERGNPYYKRGRRLAAQQVFGGTKFWKASDWGDSDVTPKAGPDRGEAATPTAAPAKAGKPVLP